MTKPYHMTKGASQGNAFTAWMDGQKSCMAPTSCAEAAQVSRKRGRHAKDNNVRAESVLRGPSTRQNISIDKFTKVTSAKQSRMRKAAI